MKIILMRHGKSRIDKPRMATAAEFHGWVGRYAATGIDTRYPPPPQSCKITKSCRYIVCSDLPRSLESAEALGFDTVHLSSPQFREVGMPAATWHFPKLPIAMWLALFRIAWFCGYSRQVESFAEAKVRSRQCANSLVDLAAEHGAVILIGHGWCNFFLGRHLTSIGWQKISCMSGRYWGLCVFSHDSKEIHDESSLN